MNIAILTQYYPPEMGAPQARLSELARFLSGRGHKVVVLTATPNYPLGRVFPGYALFQRDVVDGILVIRCPLYPTQKVALVPRLASYLSFACSSTLVGALTLPPIDVLLSESPPLFVGIPGFLLSRLKGAKWIFNVSDLWPESAVKLGVLRAEGPAHALAQLLVDFCYRRSWLVTGQTQEILEGVRARRHDARTYHLSNGVDVERFRPECASAQARASLTDAPDSVVALYAGLHGIAQGLEQILDAAAQLSRLPALRFVLVGAGPEKAALQERAKLLKLQNLTFLPPVGRDEMPALVASADIALVPLKGEIFGAVPSKLYEAMSAARPVVLVAKGEGATIVESSGAGLVVTPGDIFGLAAAVERLAKDAVLRQSLGQAGRQAAVARFSRARIVDEFAQFLDTALGAQASK